MGLTSLDQNWHSLQICIHVQQADTVEATASLRAALLLVCCCFAAFLLPQVCGLLANPWLQHMECHHLLAALAGVLVELGQRQQYGAAPSGIACGVPYSQQLQQLMLTWQAPELRR
jgi:hypothetical protein